MTLLVYALSTICSLVGRKFFPMHVSSYCGPSLVLFFFFFLLPRSVIAAKIDIKPELAQEELIKVLIPLVEISASYDSLSLWKFIIWKIYCVAVISWSKNFKNIFHCWLMLLLLFYFVVLFFVLLLILLLLFLWFQYESKCTSNTTLFVPFVYQIVPHRKCVYL